MCKWEVALGLVSDLVGTYRELYPACWPVLGVQLALFGKILVHLEREIEGVPVLREAITILRKTSGGGSGAGEDQVLVEAERLLREAEWSLGGLGCLEGKGEGVRGTVT